MHTAIQSSRPSARDSKNQSRPCKPSIEFLQEDVVRASRSLKAMSHELRLKILCVLGNGETNVQDLVTNVGTSQSNISQHLRILRDMHIITSRKDANRVFYRILDERTLQLISLIRELFCSHH